jgi:hypothetical protein
MVGNLSSRLFVAVVAVFILLTLSSSPARAQSDSEVTGQVVDSQGQPLSGIEIKLYRAGGQPKTQPSDAGGNFRFADLPGGVYIPSAAKDGYAPVTCPGMRLVGGMTRKIKIHLAATGGTSTCEAAE